VQFHPEVVMAHPAVGEAPHGTVRFHLEVVETHLGVEETLFSLSACGNHERAQDWQIAGILQICLCVRTKINGKICRLTVAGIM
jgi:hypothetical protein